MRDIVGGKGQSDNRGTSLKASIDGEPDTWRKSSISAGQGHTGGHAGTGRGGHKLSVVKTKALVDTLAYRVKEVYVKALCYTLAEVDAKTLMYALTDRLPVVEEEKVGNMPAKVECKA